MAVIEARPQPRPAKPDMAPPKNLTELVQQELPYQYVEPPEATFILGDGPVTTASLADQALAEQVAAGLLGAPMPLQAAEDQIVIDGPAQDFGEATRKLPLGSTADIVAGQITEASIRAMPWQSMWWYFNGKPRRVTKALRVPYTIKLEGSDELIIKHLLIGYEGIDPNG